MWGRRFEPKSAARQAVLAAREAVGDRLLGATLYGSAYTGDFDPRHSDLNVAFVFSALGPAELESLRPAFRRWTRLRLARPLLLSKEDLLRSLDTFPLEYLLIREHHETLEGHDHFAGLAVDKTALRSEIERLLRTQELGLNWTYLAFAGTSPGAKAWMARAGAALSASASGMLYLIEGAVPRTRADLIERCVARLNLPPTELQLLMRRSHGAESSRVLTAAHAILSRLIDEVERLDASTLTSR